MDKAFTKETFEHLI